MSYSSLVFRKYPVVLLVLLTSLSTAPAETTRIPGITAVYPPELHYFGSLETQSTMRRMSDAMVRILDVMSTSGKPLPTRRIIVLEQLDLIQSVADEIGRTTARTQHLMLDLHLEDFKSAIDKAISGAKAEPPEYFFIGQLMGSCLGCHVVNR